MGSSACVDSVLYDLELINSGITLPLEWELRFLRTFLLVTRKWNKDLNVEYDDNKVLSLGNLLFYIEEMVSRHAQGFNSRCLTVTGEREYGSSIPSTVNHMHLVDYFSGDIKKLYQKINAVYLNLSYCITQSSFTVRDDLMEIIGSLLENLVDLLRGRSAFYGDEPDIESLEEKIRFLKNFIVFATMRGVEHSQLDALLIHVEVAVVKAAHFSYMFWNLARVKPKDDQARFNISQLLQNIRPVDPFVREIYIQVLIASKSSNHHILWR